jgi:hypothetical protein
MKEPKQIAYFYDAKLADEETELDLDGTIAVPIKATLVNMTARRGESSM